MPALRGGPGKGDRVTEGSATTFELDPELRRLYLLLRQHPDGLREYDVLEILRGTGPVRGLDELELFRVHFLLFHQLHRLRQQLQEAGLGTVEVDCLRIRLVPLQGAAPNPASLPSAPDPLAAYYLDLANLDNTSQEDVRDMLRWFWKRYRAHGRREEALDALGLPAQASATEIRARYRELVLAHHPDRGGCAEEFLQVVEAMEVLRLSGSSR